MRKIDVIELETGDRPNDEVARLLRQIYALTVDIRRCEDRRTRGSRFEKEVALEHLRWRLAAAARRGPCEDAEAAA